MSRKKWQDLDLVFPSMAGTPIQGHRISHELRDLIELSGELVIRFHNCRYTAASIMLNHGIPPVIVSGMLGHSISILLTNYSQFSPTMQDEAARLMDDILTPIPIDLKPKR